MNILFKNKIFRFTNSVTIIYTLVWSIIIPTQIFAQEYPFDARFYNVALNQKIIQMPDLEGERATEYLKNNGLYESLGEAIKAARYSINWIEKSPVPNKQGAFEADNPNNNYSAYFQNDGVHLISKDNVDGWRLQMNLKGFGYGENIFKVQSETPKVQNDKTRIEIRKSAIENPNSKIVEWYENKKEGLEQGWTLEERPQGNSTDNSLNLVLEIGGNLEPELPEDKQSLLLKKKNGKGSIRYEKLKAWDANGKVIPTRMKLSGKELILEVEDKDAIYPLTIDPLFTQVKKIFASDAANGKRFGQDVAISGDTVVVGDISGSTNGEGAAYIFNRNQGGGDNWGEVKIITASDGSPQDQFGVSVDISHDTIVVGASADSTNTITNHGSAYIFERNQGGADNWGEVKKIVGSNLDSTDFFGSDVSINTDTVAISSTNTFGTNSVNCYIFERNLGGVNNWGERKTITPAGGIVSGSFGSSIEISDNTIVVGASREDITPNNEQGAAYIFERNQGGADNWGQTNKLISSNIIPAENFGISVSIDNDIIAVGANNRVGSPTASGSVYIFERNQNGINNWGIVKRLFASDRQAMDDFGDTVSLDNNLLIISDAGDQNNEGVSYIYERNQGGVDNWGLVKTLLASDGQIAEFFGSSTAICGNFAIVASVNDSLNNNGDIEGSAYIFRTDNLNWVETARPISTDGTDFDQFGTSVSISGDTAIVGAPNDEIGSNQFQGSAYIFQRNTNGSEMWGQVAKVTASDGGSGDEFGISVSISGDTAIVGAYKHNFGGSNTDQGAAYIYERNKNGADAWGQVTKITSVSGTTGDNFGISVSISGDTAVVGANRDEVSGQFAQGSASVFYRNQFGADVWGGVKYIVASDGTGGDLFGTSVAISGDTVIVGAPQKDIGSEASAGAAYIFERNQGGISDNWGEVKRIVDSPVQALSNFGQSVAIDIDTVIAGSPKYDTHTNQNVGSATIYERNRDGADNWGIVTFPLASDRAANDEFGTSVSIDKDQAIVGSPFADVGGNSNQGAAYIYERNRGSRDVWGEFKKITASSGAAGDEFGLSVAINRNHVAVGSHRTDIASPFSQTNFKSNLAGADQGAAFIYRANPFAPTAANVSISGRVLSADGRRGVPRTLVNLTDSSGNIRTARTNQFGYFNFSNITVGETYTITAFSKGFEFQTQVINVSDSINNLEIRPISKSSPGESKSN